MKFAVVLVEDDMKRVMDYTMLIMILGLMIFPGAMTFANYQTISMDENRYFADMPWIFTDEETYNIHFNEEYENWINDHIGFRSDMIAWNAEIQYYLFHNLSRDAMYLGKNDDLNFATLEMLRSYQHLDLRSEEYLESVVNDYQVVADWIESKDIQFYFMQCYDKHSICPEQFMDYVNQYGTVSKTDQLIDALENKTNMKVISVKESLLKNKKTYTVYSRWGDPTHWSPRGAYIGYLDLMNMINANSEIPYRILRESDYQIDKMDGGTTLNGVIHQEDEIEWFEIREPQAVKTDEPEWMQRIVPKDETCRNFYVNAGVDNSSKLLLLGDSYVNSYILDDIAESFSQTCMTGAGLGSMMALPDVLEAYQPNIVVFECVERADMTYVVGLLASEIRNGNIR